MGAFFFDIWLFLPKCLKNTVKQVSPPLIFHSLWSINGAPVLPREGKCAGFRGDHVQGVQWAPQVVKWSRAGLGTCALGVRAVSLCFKDTVFAQCWQSRESHPQIFSAGKVSLCGWVGGWVWAASDELTSQIPISLSPPIALLSLLWAGFWLCPALPTQLCLVLGSCYRADGWLGSTVGDKHCMNNIVLNSKTQSPRG